MFSFIPNKFILVSVMLHGLFLGEAFFKENKEYSLSTVENTATDSVEVLLQAQTEIVKKELKKIIQKKIKVSDFEHKKIKEASTHVISLENLKASSDLSPDLKFFLKSLRNEILKRQHYPYLAKRLRQTGKVSVQFDVYADGTVKNVSIYKRSAYANLNNSAVKIIDDISKVDNFPKKSVKSNKISITIPIEYSL